MKKFSIQLTVTGETWGDVEVNLAKAQAANETAAQAFGLNLKENDQLTEVSVTITNDQVSVLKK